MADTSYLKREVDRYIRDQLAVEFGVPFQPRVQRLETSGTHEFDAVSEDGRVVAAIKPVSGLTAGRNTGLGLKLVRLPFARMPPARQEQQMRHRSVR